jgi:hypothetical protein
LEVSPRGSLAYMVEPVRGVGEPRKCPSSWVAAFCTSLATQLVEIDPGCRGRVDEGGVGGGGVHLHVGIDQLAGGDDVAGGGERDDGRAVVPAVVGVAARAGRRGRISRRAHRRAEVGAEEDRFSFCPLWR